MLFEIDQSIADALEGNDAPDDDLIFALEKLALAYRTGAHLITGNYRTLTVLKNCESLPLRHRSIYKEIFNGFPSTAGAYSRLARKIVVVADQGVLESTTTGTHKVIRLSAALICNAHLDSKVVFLTENLADINLYLCIARAYQAHCNTGYFPLQLERIGGGGSTIANQYMVFQTDRDRLCLCITDSDRKIPNGPIGRTAHDLGNVDDASRPMCEHVCLVVREAENLLSASIYSETLSGNPNVIATIGFLEAVERSAHIEARHYFDIKDGMNLFEIIGPTVVASCASYWSRTLAGVGIVLPTHCRDGHPCTRKEDCQCIVIRGLGSSIMEQAVSKVLTQKSPRKLIEMIDGLLEPEWMRIGELVTAWFCGRSVISV